MNQSAHIEAHGFQPKGVMRVAFGPLALFDWQPRPFAFAVG